MKLLKVCLALLIINFGTNLYADSIEPFGATNINGEVGNGGLSVGISQHGTITVLRWPNPSYYNQLTYKTALSGVLPTESARTLPHFGAADNMGSFAGLYFTAGMPISGMVWLRDPTFTTQQYYLSADSDVLVTQYTSIANGIMATQYDLVMPDKDVLVRHYVIDNLTLNSINNLKFVYFENLGPCLNKTEYLPMDDWIDETQNDYACLYDTSDNELVHFMPGDQDFSHVATLFSGIPDQSSVQSFLSNINKLPNGVYGVIGFDFTPDSFQVGNDSVTLCSPGRNVITPYTPQDAYYAAYNGDLQDSLAAECEADGAVIKQFSLDAQGKMSFTVYFSFAKDYTDAQSDIDYAKNLGWQAILDNTNTWWNNWLSTAQLPSTQDQTILNFSKRTLITIRLATDNITGSIVASISTQPPYAEDWPRDGSFINYALDIAGYHDMVTKHNLFYAKVQRKAATNNGPAGSFDMNFYADGMPGGPIPFEIDETGLAVWTMWIHTGFLPTACERVNYMNRVWSSIKLGTQALVNCKDTTNNLQCYANEDDNPVQTQTLQGAIAAWLGIESGIQAAIYMNDKNDAAQWQVRANQLKQAIITNFYVSSTQYTNNIGAASWAIWPAEFLPYTSTIMQDQSNYLLGQITPALTYQVPVISYIGKATVALAAMFQNNASGINLLDPLIYDLLYNVPTQDTGQMGEVAVVMTNTTTGKEYYNDRVAIPHVWEATLSYLTLMARYNPQDFYPPYLPDGPETCPSSAGCSCNTTGRVSVYDLLFLVILIPLAYVIIKKLIIRV